MFTGIVTDIGYIKSINYIDNKDLLLEIALANSPKDRKFEIGCSVACNGICLTLIEKKTAALEHALLFQASQETQQKTTIKNWKKGDLINLEFSLRIGDELGGHLVQGHVDCISNIIDIKPSNESWIFFIKTPSQIKKFISQKGSITINGTSLTINHVNHDIFDVNIIPHTFSKTNFHKLKISDPVNIEIDMIARYLEKLITK